MTVAEKLKSWLDEIGADGLMVPAVTTHIYQEDSELERAIESWGLDSLVPAYRHADGTYHAEVEVPVVCVKMKCCEPRGDKCECRDICEYYQSWLAHKEATK